ncbi:hypothetical protein [Kiloniella sp. b19]|uniref:hypothetical protein n=1 Tax=Kiloniella sp. GXU_MW_B19 TaxID=3141326 RepID=UPI0031DE2A3B
MEENSRKLKFFSDFYARAATPEGWICKSDIQLEVFASVAANMILLKRERDDWVFTLIGTGIVEEYRRDFTGFSVQEIPHDECRTLYRETIEKTSTHVRPFEIRGDFCCADGNFIKASEISVPLSEDGQSVTHVLILCVLDRSDKTMKLYDDEKRHDSFSYSIEPLPLA